MLRALLLHVLAIDERREGLRRRGVERGRFVSRHALDEVLAQEVVLPDVRAGLHAQEADAQRGRDRGVERRAELGRERRRDFEARPPAHDRERRELAPLHAGLLDAPLEQGPDVGRDRGEIDRARQVIAAAPPLDRVGEHELANELRREERVAFGAVRHERREPVVHLQERAHEPRGLRAAEHAERDAHVVARRREGFERRARVLLREPRGREHAHGDVRRRGGERGHEALRFAAAPVDVVEPHDHRTQGRRERDRFDRRADRQLGVGGRVARRAQEQLDLAHEGARPFVRHAIEPKIEPRAHLGRARAARVEQVLEQAAEPFVARAALGPRGQHRVAEAGLDRAFERLAREAALAHARGAVDEHERRAALDDRRAHRAPHDEALFLPAEQRQIAQAKEPVRAGGGLGLFGEELLGARRQRRGGRLRHRRDRGRDAPRRGRRMLDRLRLVARDAMRGDLGDRHLGGLDARSRDLLGVLRRLVERGLQRVERGEHVRGVERAIARLEREHLVHEIGQPRGHVGDRGHEPRRRDLQATDEPRAIGGAWKWPLSGAHFERERAHREEIAPRAEALERARALLGGHVLDGADHRVAIEPPLDAAPGPLDARDAEIEQRGAQLAPERPLDEHVLGLDVEVQDAVRVRVRERVEQAPQHVAHHGPAWFLQRRERDALDVLHHEQRCAAVVAQQIEHGDDAWVTEARDRDHLRVEQTHRAGITQKLRANGLDRDVAPALFVAAPPHLAHAAATEQDLGAVSACEQ